MDEQERLEFEQLKQKVEDLETWKAEREKQQVTFPLDPESVSVLSKYLMRMTGSGTYEGGVGGQVFPFMEGEQDGLKFQVFPGFDRYTANASTDLITIVDQTAFNRYAEDQQVVLFSEDTAPGGLSGFGLTTYYVVEVSTGGHSFKLSATEGGAAINITDAGTGAQFIQKL